MSEIDPQELEFSQLLLELPFDDTARPEHADHLREQALRMFDQANGGPKATPSWRHTFTSWRELMRRPIPRLIAVAIFFLAIAAPWLLTPGQPATAFAFEKFATRFVEAKTARFQMHVTIDGKKQPVVQAYYLAPGKFRQEMSFGGAGSVSISDENTGRAIVLTPATKTALVTTAKNKPQNQPSKDPFWRLRDLLSQDRTARDPVFKPIGEQEINGKPAVGFRSDSAWGQATLWGDPKTGQLVRVDAVWSGMPRSEVIMSDFQFDVELDVALFDLTPPPSYQVQTFEVDFSQPVERDLIEAFKTCGAINATEYPDSLGLLGQTTYLSKATKDRFKQPSETDLEKLKQELTLITRGFRFALDLPESADAHYAGKGVKPGTAATPIFWYKPAGLSTYRVIGADLTVKDADAAPQVRGAERLHKLPATAQ